MMYDRYAAFYDSSGQVRYALLIAPYINQLLHHHVVNIRRALDIACGTGTLALLLADEGWDVIGLDLAEQMLYQARAKAANAIIAGRATFIQGDMRRLADYVPPASQNLITCTYDSLNYMLTEADLAACFSGVAHALAPGGLFLTDMNTRYFLEYDWEACEIIEQSGYIQVSQSRFDATYATNTLTLTGFIGDDSNGYERFDEVHIERAYAEDDVRTLLSQANLHIEAVYDCFTLQEPEAHAQRLMWVVRKPCEQP